MRDQISRDEMVFKSMISQNIMTFYFTLLHEEECLYTGKECYTLILDKTDLNLKIYNYNVT